MPGTRGRLAAQRLFLVQRPSLLARDRSGVQGQRTGNVAHVRPDESQNRSEDIRPRHSAHSPEQKRPFSPKHLAANRLWPSTRSAPFRALPVLSAICRETAPLNFQRSHAGHRSYVYHQPLDTAQEAACMAALEECPVEAIGRDG